MPKVDARNEAQDINNTRGLGTLEDNTTGHKILTIQAVRDNERTSGIEMVRLSDGAEVTIDTAVDMAIEGKIANVIPVEDSLGRRYLRTFPDGDKNNNMDSLPRF